MNTEIILTFVNETAFPWLLDDGLKILGIAIGAYVVTRVSKFFITRGIRKIIVGDENLSPDAEVKREDTLIRIVTSTSNIAIVLVAFLMVLSQVGVAIAPLIAAMGIAGVALGFGGQYLIRDIISGLFIILENQYRVGDVISVGSVSGSVEDITLRMTSLRDLDGVVHHVPHGEITTVSNMTKIFSRLNIDMGVGYGVEIDKAAYIINNVGHELIEDPEWKDKIIEAPEFLRVQEFADSAVILKILGKTKPGEQWGVAGEFKRRLKIAFDKEGIEIPFPQMVVHKG